MENKSLSGYGKLEESDYKSTGSSRLFSNSKTSWSYQQGSEPDECLLKDFQEEETFVLSEEYVMMEAEYVMWPGTAPCKSKSMKKSLGKDCEEPLILPTEDSMQHLGEYFTLKTVNRPIH